MIQTVDIDTLVDEVARGLLHEESPCSYNVVVPPGFGEHEVAESLIARVQRAAPGRPIAKLTMDEIADGAAFVARLAEGLQRPLPAAASLELALRALLEPREPALYVLQRFHRILDTIPPTLLACLRTAEQFGRARAIAIAPASHPLLKRRWEAKHPVTVSDYGDKHVARVVRLVDAPTIAARVDAYPAPSHIRDVVIAATGGYPEPLTYVLDAWRREGSPTALTRPVRELVQREATAALLRLVDWLDHGGEHFQDYVVDLHHGYRPDEALTALRQHELRDLLLVDDALRARSLALAALQRQRERLLQRGDPGGVRQALDRARELYLRGDYGSTLKLLSAESSLPAERLLRHHATIMQLLTDVEPGLDTEWGSLVKALDEARRWLGQQPGLDETGALTRRYDALNQLARTIQAVKEPRVVDCLARPRPDGRFEPEHVRAALFLLTLHLDHARKRRGPAEALQQVLALPEQLYRVWACWCLGLDYYAAPAITLELAATMRRNWGDEGELELPEPGKQFPSFWSFALCAVASQGERGKAGSAPARDWAEMNAALQMLRVRNNPAHSLATTTKSLREKYFQLCTRWLAAVFAAVPQEVGEISEEDLFRLLAPLPLLHHGALDWSPADSRA